MLPDPIPLSADFLVFPAAKRADVGNTVAVDVGFRGTRDQRPRLVAGDAYAPSEIVGLERMAGDEVGRCVGHGVAAGSVMIFGGSTTTLAVGSVTTCTLTTGAA